jgi:RES domain-containing protein
VNVFRLLNRWLDRKTEPKQAQITLRASVGSSASLGMEVIRGNTGRRTPVSDDYYEVETWAKKPAQLLAGDVIAERCRRALEKTLGVPAAVRTFFRGRRDDGSVTDWKKMGPPEASYALGGRYNQPGQPVLYLATSRLGVQLEIPKYDSTLCIQTYRIDTGALRIADLTSPTISDLLKAAFDLAEASNYADYGRQDFALSQLLAEFVRGAGFDGMLVPGVRGARQHQYCNLVLFRPAQWEEWSTREEGFERLRQGLLPEALGNET